MRQLSGAGRDGAVEGLGRGLVLIVVAGVMLGLAYNAVGLHVTGSWGLGWVGASAGADAAAGGPLGDAGANDAAGYGISDDPMAIPATAGDGGLPDIPELDRPIQMQLPVVKKFFDEQGALFVDARDAEAYAAGHIPGSLNLPFDDVITDPERLTEVDSGGRPIIVYCSGGTCESSTSLAWELIGNGHTRVLVFHGGWPAWEEAGYEVATLETGAGGASAAGATVVSRDVGWFLLAVVGLALGLGALAGRGPGMATLGRILRSPLAVRLAALAIGAIMGVAGMAKIGDVPAFAKQIANYHLMPEFALNLSAMTLPWIELVIALALIVGIRRRAGGVLAVALLVVFTAAIGIAAYKGYNINCGCFGKSDSTQVGLVKMAQNVGMLLLALVAAVRPR